MSEQNERPPGPPENPWNRWGAKVGLHLAFWAYPHKDVKKAEEVAKYPPPWEHAVPGKHLPADWPAPAKDANGHLLQDGWNTQHNANGTLENQFMVSINRKTKPDLLRLQRLGRLEQLGKRLGQRRRQRIREDPGQGAGVV